MPLSPTYNPKDHESRIYQTWLEAGVGNPEHQQVNNAWKETEPTHSILMPPPNLTGNLHVGHSFQHFLMDTLSRIARQKGQLDLWYPGVDHAGLQLEGVIDKLIRNGEFDAVLFSRLSRGELPKDQTEFPAFLKENYPDLWIELAWSKVNDWRDNQKNQAAMLGDTPDYSRQLFTLDQRATDMVMHAFKTYWEDGLLYKSSYLINWSIGLQTALSDVSGEIEYEKRIDPFITFEYRPVRFDMHSSSEQIPLIAKLHHYFDQHPVEVSTVRPETIFGDVAVAMHPNRFTKNLQVAGFDLAEITEAKNLIRKGELGMFLGIKSLNVGDIRLILAEEVDEDFGSGSLKITPASDIVDYQIFHKYIGGDFPESIGRDGKLTAACGLYVGLTVEQGRIAVIKRLLETGFVPVKEEFTAEKQEILSRIKAQLDDTNLNFSHLSYQEALKEIRNLLGDDGSKLKIDFDYEHNVAICERSKTVIEPLISEEFFVSFHNPAVTTSKSLRQHGIEGVVQTQFFSPEFQDRALNFLDSIKDWCISRNLLWGHRIPVWYNLEVNPERRFYSYVEWQASKEIQQGFYIGAELPTDLSEGDWVQEEKILDTWFSSCLWPLSTLGFKDYKNSQSPQTNDFARFYPTQEMTTAKEIFYLWIVRMTVLGKYFTSHLAPSDPLYDTIPFQKVVITPTILDDKGRKMSKSLGNVLDPQDQIENFSSDALRLAMLGGMIPNRNMRMGGSLADNLCQKYRNFGNKLWNVARFFEYQIELEKFDPKQSPTHLTSASLWILQKYQELEQSLENNLQTYELAHSVDALYTFLWDYFADWYVEYLKTDTNQLSFAYQLLKEYIKTLSPYAPFESQVLWGQFFQEKTLLAFTIQSKTWAQEYLKLATKTTAEDFEMIVQFISELRSLRGLFTIDPGVAVQIYSTSTLLNQYAQFIFLTSKAEIISENRPQLYSIGQEKVVSTIDILTYVKDKNQEIGRAQKTIQSLEKQIAGIEAQLSNQKFLEHALPEVVLEKQTQLEDRTRELASQKEKLAFLQTV